MSMVHECRSPGCGLLTMGDYCIHHEHPHVRAWPRRLTAATALTVVAALVALARHAGH